jgi:hypothetical protein
MRIIKHKMKNKNGIFKNYVLMIGYSFLLELAKKPKIVTMKVAAATFILGFLVTTFLIN